MLTGQESSGLRDNKLSRCGGGMMQRMTSRGSRLNLLLFFSLLFSIFMVHGLCGPESVSAAISNVANQPGATGNASLTINKPTGTAAGHVLIANFCQVGYDTNGPSSSGWTELSSADLGGTDRGTVLYKVAGVSEPASYTFSISDATDANITAFVGTVSAFSGVDTSTPFDVIGTHQVQNNNTITAPGITTVTDNAMVMFLAQIARGVTLSSWTTANAGNLSEISDYNGGYAATVGAATTTLATHGATGTGTADISGTASRRNGGILVALKPLCVPPAAPTAANNGPICAGETLNLTATPVAGATYSWSGPNGFTSTEQNPAIANATTAATGTYSVTATVNGCTSPAGTTEATVKALPTCSTITTNAPAVCAGSPGNTASAAPVDGATYSWTVSGGTMTAGGTTNAITWTAGVAGTASISVTITKDECLCTSGPVSVTLNPVIVSCEITAQTPVFYGSTRNTASTVAGPAGSNYHWDFIVDGVERGTEFITSNPNAPTIYYTAPSSFTEMKIGVVVTPPTGCACINDPIVSGIPDQGALVSGTESIAVPTFSQWGLTAFLILLGGVAIVTMRRSNAKA